jgi:hypothetical protein
MNQLPRIKFSMIHLLLTVVLLQRRYWLDANPWLRMFYGLKTDKEFVNTLEENIHERGAMDRLISDYAKAENSNRVKQIRRALCISLWFSEPYHENQNFAENQYRTLKQTTNRVINFSGAPTNTWLLAMMYVS